MKILGVEMSKEEEGLAQTIIPKVFCLFMVSIKLLLNYCLPRLRDLHVESMTILC